MVREQQTDGVGSAGSPGETDAVSVSVAIVERLATATGREPDALPPLYRSVDPDALERLVAAGGLSHVSFSHAGCDVTVSGDGRVTVTG
ncbi:HalOD1 output domain-containing protein [Halosimplex amylolyticum]|uniref:HalOD1 output domain-containing protein n=1 Tax=Halosimplex amylolyticum TaxID=3396616 RepID=UPI003F57E65E